MNRDRLHFLFLNIGHFLDHMFTLIFATVAALALSREWGLTYGQLLAHVADGQFVICGMVKDGKPVMKGFEKSATTKTAILQALNEGFAYCDSAYAGLTDASSADMASFFGNQRTKLSILSFNTAHTMEHYGNMVTYMRMNKIVPPSSESAR
jgi:uncharacterized damage-inducible protein DinB